MERPVITEFMGDGFTLNKAHEKYLENLELWNYVQALDAYCDDLEDKLREGYQQPDTEAKCNKHCCVHCGRPVVFDDYSATWIHDREYKKRDNGLYCFEDTTYFTAAPHKQRLSNRG